MRRIVSLLTDFGGLDGYVGQLKAALLSVAPAATLVDLTHEVPPQDVRAAAFLLWSAVEPFPPGSVHLAVVDPGVGGARRAVAVRAARGDLFVGPDNGLLVPAIERLGGVREAVELRARRYFRAAVSNSFHGRDVFGPVAGQLARGLPLRELGPSADGLDRSAGWPPPTVGPGGALRGRLIHVDRYGNLITNLPATALPARFGVAVAGRPVGQGPSPSYDAVARGRFACLVGSSGLLEIARRDGDAARALRARTGSRVTVTAVDGKRAKPPA